MLTLSKNIIDLGAGTGYWSALLKESGAESVIAIDDDSDDRDAVSVRREFYPVVKQECVSWMKANASNGQYDSHALFFSWACSDKMMEDCIGQWNGKYIFVIGEHEGGCTGTLDTYMTDNSKKWAEESYSMPRWHGINDCLRVYTRV